MTPGERNIISGNDWTGIAIFGPGTHGNNVWGNFIGLDSTGTNALGNSQGSGVWIGDGASNTLVGGTAAGARNRISYNGFTGVGLGAGTPNNNFVQANAIRFNLGTGVVIFGGAYDNMIGGQDPGAGNDISFNAGAGVQLLAGNVGEFTVVPFNNGILSNSISSNGGLGIDLGGDGVTANRVPSRPIPEPYPFAADFINNAQNYPILYEAIPESSVIRGSLISWPNTIHRVEFFQNAGADPSGYGEGATFLGYQTVETDGLGNAVFDFMTGVPLDFGQFITATATDHSQNTSEFSHVLIA